MKRLQRSEGKVSSPGLTSTTSTTISNSNKRRKTSTTTITSSQIIASDTITTHSDTSWSTLLLNAEENSFIRNTQGWKMTDAFTHLAHSDPHFIPIFHRFALPTTYATSSATVDGNIFMVNRSQESSFRVLLQIIVYQQLSGASAQSIWGKFMIALGLTDKYDVQPRHVLEATFAEVLDEEGKRKVLVNGQTSGLSTAKAKYVQNLAAAFNDPNLLKDVDFDNLEEEEISAKLTSVAGIGMWSVHMFLIFALHRPNVLPIGDLGVRKGLCVFLGYDLNYFEGKEKVSAMKAVCASWRPFSSVACYYMWKVYEEHLAAAKKTVKKRKE